MGEDFKDNTPERFTQGDGARQPSLDGGAPVNETEDPHGFPAAASVSAGRVPGVLKKVGESRAYLPGYMSYSCAIAGCAMFLFAILIVLPPLVDSRSSWWDMVAGCVGGSLLVAAGAHLFWEIAELERRQARVKEEPKSGLKWPYEYGNLTLGVQFRWLAVDAGLFVAAFLATWLIRTIGHWAQHR